MEWLDSISNFLSLLFGGTLISIVTWKFARRKAAAEAQQAEAAAKQAEAEAKKVEAEAMQEKQNYYQQMMDDMAKDRDYYKSERDNLRQKLDDIIEEVQEIKRTGENERSRLQITIENLTHKVESMEPKLCFRENCKERLAAIDIKFAKSKKE